VRSRFLTAYIDLQIGVGIFDGKGRKEYKMIDLYCSKNAAIICSSEGNREPKILSFNLFEV